MSFSTFCKAVDLRLGLALGLESLYSPHSLHQNGIVFLARLIVLGLVCRFNIKAAH
jgi:hypothetical protein